MASLIQFVARYSDGTILAAGAAATVVLALIVVFCSHRLWFASRLEAIEEHNKLADVVHGSLLAFTVFILALMLSDVRANLGRADDSVSREGSLVARLDRDLATLSGPEASRARQGLRSYIGAVTSDEWTALSHADAALAPSAARALSTLLVDARAAAAPIPAPRPGCGR